MTKTAAREDFETSFFARENQSPTDPCSRFIKNFSSASDAFNTLLIKFYQPLFKLAMIVKVRESNYDDLVQGSAAFCSSRAAQLKKKVFYGRIYLNKVLVVSRRKILF